MIPKLRGKKATEMKKKFLMVLLTVMAAFAVFTINASAATDGGNCGPSDSPASVTWKMDTTSRKLTISGKGEMGDFTTSTQPWAKYRTSIESIVVSRGVTSIGNCAFYGCTALNSVNLPPDGLTKINSAAFSDCTALTSVTIPGTITAFVNFSNVFWGCSALKSISVSGTSSTYEAYNGALYKKSNEDLNTLVFLPAGMTGTYSIPEGVTKIDTYALRDTHLAKLTLPASLTTISNSSYTICGLQYLQAFRVAEGNTKYSAVNGVLFNLDQTVLLAYPGGNSNPSYEIPAGVTYISDYAFHNCKNLTSVMLPEGVAEIGQDAFYNCSALSSIEIPDSVHDIRGYAFLDCSGLKTVNYLGSEEDWNDITIGSSNTYLKNATIHYNYGTIVLSAAWDKQHYNPGDTATATVNLYGGVGTAYAGYQFTIDSIEGMTLTSIEPIAHEGVSGETESNIDTGIFAFSLTGEENLSLDETGYDIATLTYKVNKGADDARELTFSDEQAYLADGTPVERFKTTSAPLALHDIQVTLRGDADGHATIPATTYYAKYGEAGLYTNWERTQAVTAEDFRCDVAAGYELASPMWAENGTGNTVADFADLLTQTYTASKTYTLRVGETAVLTIDTSIVTVVSGTVEKDGKHYTIKNTDLVLAPVVRSGRILLGVSASIDGQPVPVTRGADGNYTIDGSALTGDITLSYDEISGTIEFVELDTYVDDTNTASKILRVKMSEKLADSYLTLGGQPLFWSEKYKAYVEFVPDSTDEAGIRAAIACAAGEGTSIGYTGDVTGDSTVNVLDALAINAKLSDIEWKLGFTSKNLLEMDVIGETAEVDVADIQRVLAIAVGKVTV